MTFVTFDVHKKIILIAAFGNLILNLRRPTKICDVQLEMTLHREYGRQMIS